MASYVERITDFLEKQMVNEALPKNLREDIEWAVEVISSNKLYNGNLSKVELDELRPEISVWTKMISGENIPTNKEEMKRIRIQKKKYTFFMKNRVFRHWTEYVNQVQEHQIKSNYFQARWNLIHKNDILKKWKIQHLKMKANHVSK